MVTVDESITVSAKKSESLLLNWQDSCVATECTMHQLSPYIGKIKSIIAKDLILKYSKPGDLIVDPFSGSGTIPFEAILLNRKVFACDVSPYASVLTRAKLFAPLSLDEANEQAEKLFKEIEKQPDPDLRKVPLWVRKFFNEQTLKETIKAVDICIKWHNNFLLSCILGILHHQRPGFLSYPSSHLVPYLRDNKYPKNQFPELYSYRPLRPRLLSKIERAYKRYGLRHKNNLGIYRQGQIENIQLPDKFNCLITSPPYMNALDYKRDNRLRLWFIRRDIADVIDSKPIGNKKAFGTLMTSLAKKIEKSLIINGYCIFVVGEQMRRFPQNHPSEIVQSIISKHAPSLQLTNIITDSIPDVRRSRKNCRGIKAEHFLVYQRHNYAF